MDIDDEMSDVLYSNIIELEQEVRSKVSKANTAKYGNRER